MSAWLDEIEARMDREVPARDLADRDDLRRTVAAIRAGLALVDRAEELSGHVPEDTPAITPADLRAALSTTTEGEAVNAFDQTSYLTRALNWASIDALANTPDYVLAEKLDGCPHLDAMFRAYTEAGRITRGVDLIAAERQRQIDVEGYTAEHDAGHGDGIALAAACYATPAHSRAHVRWPWAPRFWKPTPDDRVRELVKAGALIAASIDAALAPDVTR